MSGAQENSIKFASKPFTKHSLKHISIIKRKNFFDFILYDVTFKSLYEKRNKLTHFTIGFKFSRLFSWLFCLDLLITLNIF